MNEQNKYRSDWYVIQTIKGQEEAVKHELEKYLPDTSFKIINKVVKRRYRGAWHEDKEVLFDGYIFVITDDPWSVKEELKRAKHFAKVVRFENELVAISVAEKETILRMTGDSDIADMSYGVIEGDNIIITSGPLQGMESKIKKIDRHKRKAIVEFSMAESSIEIEIGLEVVRKNEGASSEADEKQ